MAQPDGPTAIKIAAPQPKTPARVKPAAVPQIASLEHTRTQARRAARGRKRLIGLSFILLVLLPVSAWTAYLYTYAVDQYGSSVAFSVRSSEQAPSVEFLGALTQTLSGPAADGEIVYQYVKSQSMVEAALAKLPLVEMFNKPKDDFIFRLGDGKSVEDIHDYWEWMTDISFDASSGILEFEVRAFTPEDAQRIANLVIEESAKLVNDLSVQAREDAVKFAATEVADSEERLRALRREIRNFRQLELEIDPSLNAQSSIELVGTLEAELAGTRVRLETMRSVLSDDNPRVRFLEEKVSNLERQIERERQRVASSGTESGIGEKKPLADLLSQYEELQVERGFAENAYTTSLAIYEQAQAEARRQIRYLATHISPTLSQEPQYPKRALLSAAGAGLFLVGWLVLVLLFYNIRDRI